jgi:protein-S-isoprenylcysteine O-methyltransferase Ste14
MRVIFWLVTCIWVAFFSFWLILGLFNKRASRDVPWRRRAWAARLALFVAVLVFARHVRHASPGSAASIRHSLSLHPGIGWQCVGVGLVLIGFGFALWARVHLGRNWGMPMSLRQGHELVTSGPYAHVRHPIYSGIMLAAIGSILAAGLIWLLPLVLCFVYFLISARTEETMMIAQFPGAYRAYRRRTKMLIPFVL